MCTFLHINKDHIYIYRERGPKYHIIYHIMICKINVYIYDICEFLHMVIYISHFSGFVYFE